MPALEAESGEPLPLPLPAPPEQDASAGSSGGVDVEGALVAYESPGAPPAVDASAPPAPPEPELRVEDHRVTSSGHGVLGYPGASRRPHVVCKFHRGCGTQRSFSKKLARWGLRAGGARAGVLLGRLAQNGARHGRRGGALRQ